MSAWWFERTTDVVPNHFIRLADGTAADDLPFELPPELIGRSDDRAEGEARRCRVHRARLHHRLGVGGVQASTARSTACRMPKGMAESEQFPEPMFTPTTKADEGHDEPMTFSDLMQEVGPEAAQVLRLRSLALYNFAADVRARAGHHHRRHEVRVRLHRRRAARHRRDADAGLEPLLGRRRVQDGRPAAELRQAVRARLARASPAGTRSRRRPNCRRRRRAGHAPSATKRGLPPPDRQEVV